MIWNYVVNHPPDLLSYMVSEYINWDCTAFYWGKNQVWSYFT